jgi:hypothetical protein
LRGPASQHRAPVRRLKEEAGKQFRLSSRNGIQSLLDAVARQRPWGHSGLSRPIPLTLWHKFPKFGGLIFSLLLADLYQANFIEREELLRRGKDLELRAALSKQRQALIQQREQLAQQKRLRDRVDGFASKVRTTIDRMNLGQHRNLLRFIVGQPP